MENEEKQNCLVDEIPEPSTQQIEEFIEKINQEIEDATEEMAEVIEDIMKEVKDVVSTVEEEIVEQVVEQVVNKVIEIKSLLNLIIIISARPDMQEKYGLTPELTKILQSIVQSNASFFFEIEESFKRIVEDNKIDSKDVPELMSIFSSVYELIFSLKLKISTIETSNICGELIKLAFNVMLLEDLLIFDEKELTRKMFNALVDSSISLMKLSKTVKVGDKCCIVC